MAKGMLHKERFEELMLLLERHLNALAREYADCFARCSCSDLERKVHIALQENAAKVGIAPEDIRLVSGQRFPDIVICGRFGVEVKSTQSDHWTSTGSSIIESTRVDGVEIIYMLFGKLGGERAEFRCKPYDKCLSDIAVTHSPRYLIDAGDAVEETLFAKLGIEYQAFRGLEETEKIRIVRKYYKEQAEARGRIEMPWWLAGEEAQETSPMTLSLYSDAGREQREYLRVQIMVLFPEIWSNDSQNKFKRAALWLCMRHSLVCHNIRDMFTSGGKIDEVGGVRFEKPVPQIVKTLYMFKDRIRSKFSELDETEEGDIMENWGEPYNEDVSFETWCGMVQRNVEGNGEFVGLGCSIGVLFERWGHCL